MFPRRTIIGLLLLGAAAAPVLAQERCDNCGRITTIRTTTAKNAWSPLGSMPSSADRAVGQVTTQYNFSGGNMVMLGAAGGAGYARRPNSYERSRWEIIVRMDDGTPRTIINDYEPALREGDRVRVYGTQLELVR
jgi:hypothetical protein